MFSWQRVCPALSDLYSVAWKYGLNVHGMNEIILGIDTWYCTMCFFILDSNSWSLRLLTNCIYHLFVVTVCFAFNLCRTTWMRWWGCAMMGWKVCSTSASSLSWQPVPSLSCCVPFPGHGDKLPAGQFSLLSACLPACLPAWVPSFPHSAPISMQHHILYCMSQFMHVWVNILDNCTSPDVLVQL